MTGIQFLLNHFAFIYIIAPSDVKPKAVNFFLFISQMKKRNNRREFNTFFSPLFYVYSNQRYRIGRKLP